MRIFAHRCYRSGPDSEVENSLAAFCACLADDLAVETDIRRWQDGVFYISHDLISHDLRRYAASLRAEPYFEALAESSTGHVALNVKELGYEKELLDLLDRHGVAEKVFLFDMELLEDVPGETAGRFRALDPHVSVAARISDRNEPVERALDIAIADTIWADEMDRLWLSQDDVVCLQQAGKRVYAVSPEIHGFGTELMVRRWADFLAWSIDGICTDYPDKLSEFIAVKT